MIIRLGKLSIGFHPWHFIVLGIGLNIVSAYISHTSIERDRQQLESINEQINNIDLRLDSLWQRHQQAERKQEFVALAPPLSATGGSEQAQAARQYLQQYLASAQAEFEANQPLPTTSADAIALLARYQGYLTNSIDDLYFERIQWVKEKQPINAAISRHQNLALFMQVLGLILVLSRDLVRRD